MYEILEFVVSWAGCDSSWLFIFIFVSFLGCICPKDLVAETETTKENGKKIKRIFRIR